jgi:hypothetical protein
MFLLKKKCRGFERANENVLLVLMRYRNKRLSRVIHCHIKLDRTTTHMAVFNITLLLN